MKTGLIVAMQSEFELVSKILDHPKTKTIRHIDFTEGFFGGKEVILMKQNNYLEATTLLKQGIAISQARTNAVHRNELYETLSLCYEHLHQYQNALTAYKHFRLANDSLFNEYKERDLSEMRYQYDTERQENLIKQGKLEMLEKEQRLQQLSFILAIIVIVLVLLYYLYNRKNKLYLRIVMQNQEAIKRETELNRRIEEL